MSRRKEYNGEVVEESKAKASKGKFNWLALLLWIISLAVSLVPIYIPLVQHLIETNGEITDDFWFACFKEYDILWVFATVLLFSCINQVTIERKYKKSKNLVKSLFALGIFLFLVLEATWIVFKYWLDVYQSWPITFGSVLIVISMIIATPLQIDFIVNED